MVGSDYSGCYVGGREEQRALPDSAYLLLVDPGFQFAQGRERSWRGILTNYGWKFTVFEDVPWLMYNLNEVSYGMANLAMDHRFNDVRQTLQERLLQWITDSGDSFDLPVIA